MAYPYWGIPIGVSLLVCPNWCVPVAFPTRAIYPSSLPRTRQLLCFHRSVCLHYFAASCPLTQSMMLCQVDELIVTHLVMISAYFSKPQSSWSCLHQSVTGCTTGGRKVSLQRTTYAHSCCLLTLTATHPTTPQLGRLPAAGASAAGPY